jgi:hypothetical protein
MDFTVLTGITTLLDVVLIMTLPTSFTRTGAAGGSGPPAFPQGGAAQLVLSSSPPTYTRLAHDLLETHPRLEREIRKFSYAKIPVEVLFLSTSFPYGAILVMRFFALKSESGLSHIVIATFVGVDAQTVLKALYQRDERTWYRAILDCDHAWDILGSWVVL